MGNGGINDMMHACIGGGILEGVCRAGEGNEVVTIMKGWGLGNYCEGLKEGSCCSLTLWL